MATTTLSEFRVDPVSGLKINRTANTLVKWNAFAAVVFLLVGGLFGLGIFHRQADPLAGYINFLDPDGNFLINLDDRARILDEPVRQLADMDQAILVDADIDKHAEGRDIGDNARQLHARLNIRDRMNPFRKSDRVKLLSRIAAGFGQFRPDVL